MCDKNRNDEEIKTLEPNPVCEIFTLDTSKQDNNQQSTKKPDEN